MRYALLSVLALTASCAPFGGNSTGGNESAAQSPTRSGGGQEKATVLIVANENDCSARWNGEAVTAEALTERSLALMETAIESVGGVQQITEETLPYLRVEAAPELSYSCAGRMIGSLQRAGFMKVALKPAGSAEQPHFAYFPLTGPGVSPPPVTIAIGGGGRMTWNGAPIDLAGLRARGRSVGDGSDVPEEPPPASGPSTTMPPPVVAETEAGPPGAVAVAPSNEATFITVYRAVQALAQEGATPMLAIADAR